MLSLDANAETLSPRSMMQPPHNVFELFLFSMQKDAKCHGGVA